MALKQPRQFSHALILQADWEGGMTNVALDLMWTGKSVAKVMLHAGDWIYKWKGVDVVSFDAPIETFRDWLREYIKHSKIDCLILYNQYRPYNQIGWDLAKELNIECIVFELGLLRPDFCSIYSREIDHFDYLSSRWERILSSGKTIEEPQQPAQIATMSTPRKMEQFALYYSFSRLMAKFARRYTHYQDQRSLSFTHHLAAGIRNMLRFQGRDKQNRYDRTFSTSLSGLYYLAPLQVHSDSQITQRSDFESMEAFIRKVSNSFLKHAPSNTKLVFKVHPMDRGYKDYAKLIKKLQSKPGGDRILYLDRIHLPTALDHARGCVTINSSVGLSALIHGAPTLTLGEAAYHLEGLTFQGGLNTFWRQHGEVESEHVDNYVNLLKTTSQAYGTLYQRLYAAPGRSKISWPIKFQPIFSQESGPSKKDGSPSSLNRTCRPKVFTLQH
jgi:capsular polysaccharide export protein